MRSGGTKLRIPGPFPQKHLVRGTKSLEEVGLGGPHCCDKPFNFLVICMLLQQIFYYPNLAIKLYLPRTRILAVCISENNGSLVLTPAGPSSGVLQAGYYVHGVIIQVWLLQK